MITQSLIEIVRQTLQEASKQAFPDLLDQDHEIHVTVATQEKFGHYQCNSAMKLAKILKQPPQVIAQKIKDHLELARISQTFSDNSHTLHDDLASQVGEAVLHEHCPRSLERQSQSAERRSVQKKCEKCGLGIFSNIEIAGPGFINLTLSAQFLSELVEQMAHDKHLGIPSPAKKERVIVEFSSPNIAKEMHVGHLRSTIIGDALARLFEFLGHDVLRLNHVGDWGTAFGMLIAYMQEEVFEVLTGQQKTDLSSLMGWYKASKVRFDSDEAFKTRARQRVIALQGGELEALKAWEMICAISRVAFQEVYDLLDVKLQERGESYYNPFLLQVVADLEQKGLVTLSEGAKCVFHEGIRIPLMIQKSDGGYNYDTTDMAAIVHRIRQEQADRIIVVTDAGQSLHFDLIRKTAEKAGYLDPTRVRFDHVPFGVVLGTDGKKFRTRSGETEKLIDLLKAAIREAARILEERDPQLDPQQKAQLARILGIDAVKYADLSCNRISDYVFSYERMLRFEGNTAAFILYSYVRVKGIKRKVGDIDLSQATIVLEHPSEIDLGLHLLRFCETLDKMQEELFPHYLTDYLFLLAQKFNAFFRDCRVEGVPEQQRRLLLADLVARTMECGLHILGIQVVDKM
jgi:arginyl-tRNA synthetase